MLISRRDVLKSFIGSIACANLYPLLNGCATLNYTKENVDNIAWNSNTVIPIPANGCYVGWHTDFLQDYLDMDRKQIVKRLQAFDSESVNKYLGYHEEKGGCTPAVFSFFNMHVGADWFPMQICAACHSMGIVPLIRFYYPQDHSEIVTGKFDDQLKKFADNIAEFRKPIFFVPWPVINYYKLPKGYFSRTGKIDAEAAHEAWIRMYRIFDAAGANNFTVWGLNIVLDGSNSFIDKFKLEPNYFDWMGFTVYDTTRWVQNGWISRDLKLASDWAKSHYPDKPVAIFELAITDTQSQGEKIKTAYNTIKDLPRIKMVMYCQFFSAGFGGSCTLITNDAKASYKEAISDPYFIKASI